MVIVPVVIKYGNPPTFQVTFTAQNEGDANQLLRMSRAMPRGTYEYTANNLIQKLVAYVKPTDPTIP